MEHSCIACAASAVEEFLYTKHGFDIFRCKVCGIGRTAVENFDPQHWYDEAYFSGGAREGYADYLASERVLRAEFARSAELLRSYVKPGGRVLEIGAAFGFFLLEASRSFKAEGIEISDHAAGFARSRGLTVRTGAVTEAALNEMGRFDAIVMFDVIEHLSDPYETLALCWQHLNPGGIVMFTTGDFGSVLARTAKDKWRLMSPPYHLFYFTKASVQALAGRLGARLQLFDHPWKIVPLELILFQLPSVIGLNWKPKVAIGANVGIPVNLFDAMRVVLQKPLP